MEAISERANRVYICLADRTEPEEKQTLFIIGDLNPAEEAYLRDAYSTDEDGNTVIKTGTEFYRALNVGLIAVENLTAGGETVEVTRDPAKGRLPGGKAPWGDSLKRIPRQARDEVALEIIKATLLTESDLKNL
jgi:hypothetical protein